MADGSAYTGPVQKFKYVFQLGLFIPKATDLSYRLVILGDQSGMFQPKLSLFLPNRKTKTRYAVCSGENGPDHPMHVRQIR